MEALKRYCMAINGVYANRALRSPTEQDVNRVLDASNSAGWPGCLGSIDCMHWAWKNCPSSWKGMFQGKEGVATIVLEAIADHRCRFWHFNFGSPGSLNDLSILDRSTLYDNAMMGITPTVNFSVKGNDYNVPYWLADGIYPEQQCFVKSLSHNPNAVSRKSKLFSCQQEAKRKDVERAFGILQARFHILTIPCKLWDRDAMSVIMKSCVILHNMIIDFEEENGESSEYIHDSE